ncbi:MAG: YgjV family protein [Oscillospiraceae bacterium]|nr:YgjV family protein [Oscillospiraceae bacterium]MBQ7129545.1 YgjV family protein [Oscillospiraceae bacterium]
MNTAALLTGLAAVFFCLLCYQFRERRAIIACNVVSRVLYVLQYLLLFAFEGAAMDLSAIPSSMLASRKNHPFVFRHRKLLWFGGNLLILFLGIAVWQNVFSVLPIIGVLLETNALWLTREKHIRLMSLASVPFWLSYNLICGAYGSVIGNVLMIVSILTALYRHDRAGSTSG